IGDPADRVDPDPRTPNQSTLLYSVADPRGAETVFDYYGPGSSLDRGKLAARTDRAGAVTGYTYDFVNRVTTVSAPEGRDWTYGYDPFGRPTQITDPAGQVTEAVWTADHAVARITEPSGAITRFGYNANGYLTDRTDAEDGHTRLAYRNLPVDEGDTAEGWPEGRDIPHISDLESLVEPNGNDITVDGDWTWTFDHEAATGNLDTVTDPEGHTTAHTYDIHGQLAATTDANGNQTVYAAYDASGLPTQVVDAEGGVSRLAYDADGLLLWQQTPLHAGVAVEDASWARTEFFYDSFGRLGAQSAPKDAAREPGELIWSAAGYDPNDNLTSQSDAAFGREFTPGPQWRTDFDVMDRPVRSTSPNTETDPDGARVETGYDTAGRPTVVRSPQAVLTGDTQGWSTFYDYDPLDRVIRTSRFEVTANQADPQAVRTHQCYDTAGDLVAAVAPNADLDTVDCANPPAGHTSTFAYDRAHRPVSASDPDGHTTSQAYDANGNLVSATDAEGATASYTYDQRGLVTRVDSPFDGNRTVTEVFGYDGAGNRILAVSPRGFDAAGGTGPFTDHVTRPSMTGCTARSASSCPRMRPNGPPGTAPRLCTVSTMRAGGWWRPPSPP
ncbi:MAG: hypothetical protein GEV12_23585, partial [Micromonosporaceae bacterium]|nr:hypothetical protein [Micromonosporaceae bacterium]